MAEEGVIHRIRTRSLWIALVLSLGAFFFGWLGDKTGRKYTFIVTLTGMGLATALIPVSVTMKV